MLSICEKHGRRPDWWSDLTRDEKARLLAKHRFDEERRRG